MVDSMTLDEALRALQRRDYRRAEKILSHLIETGKSLTPELAIPLARVLKELNRTDEAKRHLHDVLRSFPGSKRAHAVLGDMYRFTGDHDEAISCYTASTIAETDDLPSSEHHDFIQDNLAVCYEAAGNFRHAESIFRALVSRHPHDLRYARHLYDNLIKQNREREAVIFAQTFMPFWHQPGKVQMIPLSKLDHENLHKRKLVVFGIDPLYGHDRSARELYAWLREKGLDVYCFVDMEASVEQFEGRPVYSIYDLLLEDVDSLLVLSLYDMNSSSSFHTMTIAMSEIRDDGYLACAAPISSTNEIYEIDTCLGANLKRNPVFGVSLPGFVIYGDMHNAAALKITLLGGSTTDALVYKQGFGGIKPWAEILWEFLVGNGIPAVVYCGGICGYSSHMELLKFIRDVISIAPDIVVSYSGYNEYIGRKFPFDGFHHAGIMQKLKNVLNNSNNPFPWNFPNEYTNGLQSDKTPEQRYVDNIRAMHALSLEFSFHFVPILQTIAGFGDKGEDETLKRLSGKMGKNSDQQIAISNWKKKYVKLKDSIIPYPYALDYSNLFSGKGQDHYFDLCHVTTKGNRIIAQKVYEDLSAMGLLERKNR